MVVVARACEEEQKKKKSVGGWMNSDLQHHTPHGMAQCTGAIGEGWLGTRARKKKHTCHSDGLTLGPLHLVEGAPGQAVAVEVDLLPIVEHVEAIVLHLHNNVEGLPGPDATGRGSTTLR